MLCSSRPKMRSTNSTVYDSNNILNVSSDNETDYDGDEMFEYVTEGLLLTSISILGFIGNTLAIYVLLRPPFRGIFSHILTSLATFDALFLLTLPFTFGFPILSSYYKVITFSRIHSDENQMRFICNIKCNIGVNILISGIPLSTNYSYFLRTNKYISVGICSCNLVGDYRAFLCNSVTIKRSTVSKKTADTNNHPFCR